MECLLPDAPDVYLLTHGNNQYNSGEQRQIGGIRFYRGLNCTGAYGYVISKAAAANLLRFQTPIKCVCDWWKFFQLNGLITFYLPEIKIVAPHPELGDVSASLLETVRLGRSADMRRDYFTFLRKQVPFRLAAKYTLYKLLNWRSIRRQKEMNGCEADTANGGSAFPEMG